MATLKQRLWKKNSSGTYDTIHLETSASLVLTTKGTTVESELNTLSNNLSSLQMNNFTTGGYVGTGTYGQSNPTTFSFNFSPSHIIIFGNFGSSRPYGIYIIYITYVSSTNKYSVAGAAYHMNNSGAYTTSTFTGSTVSPDGRTISIYDTDAWGQANYTNYAYNYIAFARPN